MPACPTCSHEVGADVVRCPSCSGYLGSLRDLANLGAFLLSVLVLTGMGLAAHVVLPNLALGRAVEKVRLDDAEGIKVMAAAQQSGQITVLGQDLGWEVEQFADLFLISFTYILKEEKPKRYAVWWVFDPGTGKVTKIQRAEEFIDGHLLRRGLKLVEPGET